METSHRLEPGAGVDQKIVPQGEVMFLTPDELSQLTGYAPNQRSRIRRWLDDQRIPYRENRLGQPVVLRRHIDSDNNVAIEPKFDWLKSA